jgi:hypothetical protein
MFSVFLQHQTMNVWLWGTTFNLPNATPIEALKDLRTIVSDNKIRATSLPHIHN